MTPAQRATILRAAEIIKACADDLQYFNSFCGDWDDNMLEAEHADMLATAKALREIVEREKG